jgi:hypothetical protein
MTVIELAMGNLTGNNLESFSQLRLEYASTPGHRHQIHAATVAKRIAIAIRLFLERRSNLRTLSSSVIVLRRACATSCRVWKRSRSIASRSITYSGWGDAGSRPSSSRATSLAISWFLMFGLSSRGVMLSAASIRILSSCSLPMLVARKASAEPAHEPKYRKNRNADRQTD